MLKSSGKPASLRTPTIACTFGDWDHSSICAIVNFGVISGFSSTGNIITSIFTILKKQEANQKCHLKNLNQQFYELESCFLLSAYYTTFQGFLKALFSLLPTA